MCQGGGRIAWSDEIDVPQCKVIGVGIDAASIG